jgi:glutaredoxin-related protein
MNSTIIAEFKEYLRKKKVKYTDEEFEKNLEQIKRLLDAEISEKYYGSKGRYASLLRDDVTVKKAQEVLANIRSLKDLRDYISSKL